MPKVELREIHDAAGRRIGEAEYVNGKLDGRSRLWTSSGVLIQEPHFQNGQHDGPCQTWWDNGKPKEVGRSPAVSASASIDGFTTTESSGRSTTMTAANEALCQPPNKQLQRTVIRRHRRAASAPFHYALAALWTAQRAAAQLRCSATQDSTGCVLVCL